MQTAFCRLSVLVACLLTSIGLADSNWPRWRGPQQNGHSADDALPTQWNPGSVTWQVDLPGDGQSSPVIWGERIFLTTALDGGRQRVVMCLDRSGGKVLWKHVAWTGAPEKTHNWNGHASASCVTDGERVYAFFGVGGLHCYTIDGEPVWSKQLGSFEGPWGTAASPVLVGDLLIQNCDADANARIMAFDKRTGKEVWETKRDDRRGWSTPILIDAGTRQEVVVNGDTGVKAYDPETGNELWFCSSYKGRGTPTITPAGNLLVAVNGKRGDIYAIRPGGNGNVSETHRAWHTPRSVGRDLSSPIVIGGHVLLMALRPTVLTCYDAATGEELCKERVGNVRFSATPIAYRGLAFFTNERGTTYAVKPGSQCEIVSENELPTLGEEEVFRASITPSAGQLFIRSNKRLYCVGRRAR